MGDYIVSYLSEQNIPLFAPLNVNTLVENWENDAMGMSGGFLSQSVVTPEIDGAIRPFALFGHYADEEGMQHAFAIPERLETFVQTVNNYISLQKKPNSEKRVAVYYYKGPRTECTGRCRNGSGSFTLQSAGTHEEGRI